MANRNSISTKTTGSRTSTKPLNVSQTLTDVLPDNVFLTKRGLALKWRVVLLSCISTILLGLIAAIISFIVVNNVLQQDLQAELERNVISVRNNLTNGDSTANRSGNSSVTSQGIINQLYGPTGLLNQDNKDSFGALPSEWFISNSKDGTGVFNKNFQGEPIKSVFAPLLLSDANTLPVTIVSSKSTRYINDILRRLARALVATSLILALISSIIGYYVATQALKPISRLSESAAQLDPNNLEGLPYIGPDDEIGRLHTVLNVLIERLRDAMNQQLAFLAEASHELRTPLTSMKGFLERAQRKLPEGSSQEIDDAVRISHSMSGVVADLLQLSRGEVVREYEPFLVDVGEEVLSAIASEFPGVRYVGLQGSRLNQDLENFDEGLVLGDPGRLKQATRNIVNNAIRACGGDTSKVTLSFRLSNENVIMRIEDEGAGMPDEILNKIFEKFYKGANGGAGLGLAIVKQIVNQHGGYIEVESSVGEGTSFDIYLPALKG